jgi:hypothetical protein
MKKNKFKMQTSVASVFLTSEEILLVEFLNRGATINSE